MGRFPHRRSPHSGTGPLACRTGRPQVYRYDGRAQLRRRAHGRLRAQRHDERERLGHVAPRVEYREAAKVDVRIDARRWVRVAADGEARELGKQQVGGVAGPRALLVHVQLDRRQVQLQRHRRKRRGGGHRSKLCRSAIVHSPRSFTALAADGIASGVGSASQGCERSRAVNDGIASRVGGASHATRRPLSPPVASHATRRFGPLVGRDSRERAQGAQGLGHRWEDEAHKGD